ncbi:MAG: hypothetical protein FAF05_02485 [Epsilonproteobacteria bacterium]|nr:hypothetical protein [Campylobacterota bacterium]
MDISGKITSSNNLDGSLVRSFDYTSPLNTDNYVEIRALKVDEYLNTNNLNEYYLLSSSGEATHKIKGEDDKSIDKENIEFIFKNNTWTIKGENINFNHTLVVQGDLNIKSNHTFIAGTLMVQGDLNASGELNINTGTPFEKALIVDKNIEVDKFVAIGRVHGSGTFTAKGEVNILGNAEIDGDITLWGDAKINFLDNVYKSALYEAQQEASENNTTMMLVHSQLFSNAKGKNSVILFTFVEGNYILNENIINQLLDTNQTDAFKFKSYLYGATIDYGAQLQKFDGLSPYYLNKHKIVKKLLSQGYEGIKISESLDIAPSNLYHTFKDKNGNIIGTYQVYSLSNPFNENNLTVLTQTQRDDAIYAIDHKDEIEANQEVEAKEKQAEQKQAIIDNNDLNLTTKSEMLNEIEASENNETSINKEEVKKEATQDRVQEWVEYKDLASDKQVIDAQEITVATTQTRGWWKRIRRVFRRVFRVVTFRDCHKRTERKFIWGVDSASAFESNDKWGKKIQLMNDAWESCTPTSASMILNYHRLRKGKSSLYYNDGHWDNSKWASLIRYSAPRNNNYTKRISNKFHTSHNSGTEVWRLYWTVPWVITTELWKNGTYGYSWSHYTAFWNRTWHHNLVKNYTNRNNPIIFTAWQNHGNLKQLDNKYYSTGNHSMVVIGYKRDYYTGNCWKKFLPERKWLLVDSTWMTRGYIRFDIKSNYWKFGTMTYVRSW